VLALCKEIDEVVKSFDKSGWIEPENQPPTQLHKNERFGVPTLGEQVVNKKGRADR